MKYFFSLILLLTIVAGCKPKELSGVALQNKLIETMSDYLHKTLKPGVEITVKDVNYFTDVAKKSYICQFNVKMHYLNKDTTGVMVATITNDFNQVTRTQ